MATYTYFANKQTGDGTTVIHVFSGDVAIGHAADFTPDEVAALLPNYDLRPGDQSANWKSPPGGEPWEVGESVASGTPITIATPPNDGDVLVFDAATGQWHPSPPSGGGVGGGTSLTLTSPDGNTIRTLTINNDGDLVLT
jgi:hypothetical protein